jgi:signal peptidase I
MSEIINYRRPWLAALLSFLLTGLGQAYCGRLGRGLILLGLALLIVPLVYLPAYLDPRAYGRFSWLFVMLVVSVVTRIYVTADAWFLARRVGALRLRWYNKWYIYLGVVLISGVLGFATPYRSYSIRSASMAPTIIEGDLILAEKYAGDTRKPQPGDIAIVTRNGIFYLKRIVAVGEDHVQMIEGRLTINGVTTPREDAGDVVFRGQSRKLYRETISNARRYVIMEASDHEFLDNTKEFTVPSNSYFVLGDNRDNSQDSRVMASFGFMPAQSVVGRAVLIWWTKNWDRIGTAPE